MNTRLLSTVAASIFMTCSPLFAGEKNTRNIVSIDPLSLAFKSVLLKYERILSSSNGLGIIVKKNVFGRGRLGHTEWDAFAVGVFYKAYCGKSPLRGPYVEIEGLFGQGDYYSIAPDSYVRGLQAEVLGRREITASGAVGYRGRLWRLLISPYLGYQVPFVLSAGQRRGSVEVDPIGGLVIGIELGISFAW
jgi:hypothetical protein